MPTFTQLSAPNGTVVWALVAASRLFVSSDRGDHWLERSLPTTATGPAYEVSFIDEREGWLLMPGAPGTACTFQGVRLWHTTDGATTWKELAPRGIADFQCKRALSFVDRLHGFFGAYDPDHAPTIFATTDGGSTWGASSPLPVRAVACGFPNGPCQPGNARAFGSTLLIEVTGTAGGRLTRSVYRSSDGGTTWTDAADITDPQGGLAIITASRWIEIGLPEASEETTDGGRTWHAFTTDYGQAAPVPPGISFGSELVGYATARGSIARTIDGGAHWVWIKTPGTQ